MNSGEERELRITWWIFWAERGQEEVLKRLLSLAEAE